MNVDRPAKKQLEILLNRLFQFKKDTILRFALVYMYVDS